MYLDSFLCLDRVSTVEETSSMNLAYANIVKYRSRKKGGKGFFKAVFIFFLAERVHDPLACVLAPGMWGTHWKKCGFEEQESRKVCPGWGKAHEAERCNL